MNDNHPRQDSSQGRIDAWIVSCSEKCQGRERKKKFQNASTKLVKITDAVSRISEYDNNVARGDNKWPKAKTHHFSFHEVYHRRRLQPESIVNTVVRVSCILYNGP